MQLYDLQARYYNPTVGRFNQIDPYLANQSSSANLYVYGADDPVNNSDPSGMYEIDVHQYLTEYLAGQDGFDPGIAASIGQNTQGPDGVVTTTKIDETRSATYAYKNFKLYHFVERGRLRVLASVANVADRKTLGEFLHAQEDTFAHSPKMGGRDFTCYGDMFGLFGDTGGIYGHLFHAHNPDQTWRDADKAMMMAMAKIIELCLLPYLKKMFFG